MNGIQIKRNELLFKKKIDQIMNLFILNVYHTSGVFFDETIYPNKRYIGLSISEDTFVHTEIIKTPPNGITCKMYSEEIIKDKNVCREFYLDFSKRNLKNKRKTYFPFIYVVHPKLGGSFMCFVPYYSSDCDVTFYNNDTTILTLVVSNINKNRYLLKRLFLDFQKWIGDVNIFDFLDNIIWKLI